MKKQSESGSSMFGDTKWTKVVEPAAKGSTDALGDLFNMYESSIFRLIRIGRKDLSEEQIQDLCQEFKANCIKREFLKNVKRDNGLFRTFLKVCVERFLIDVSRRRKVPGAAKDDPQIDNGSEDEGAIQIPSEGSEEWYDFLDEPWALVVESSALIKVESYMDLRGLSSGTKMSLIKRLKAQQDDETTLKMDAKKLGVDPSEYNNLFYSHRNIFRDSVYAEIARQNPKSKSSDLQDELNHFLKVLARIRRNVPG